MNHYIDITAHYRQDVFTQQNLCTSLGNLFNYSERRNDRRLSGYFFA